MTARLLALGLAGCAAVPAARPFPDPFPPFHDGDRFAVVGDVQTTSLLEFWRESNDRERVLVVGAIAAERPAFLAITGDLVFDGSSPRKWAVFEALMTPVRDAHVPVVAAFGNHEYWGGRRSGELGLFARVPLMRERHWYALDYGPLRLVFLDSNIGVLGPTLWAEQLGFYRDTLAAAETDAEVKGVIVFLHHPPYTNSTVTGDEDFVQRDLVPPFMAARKTLVMHCGHVHSYERFARGGKMFVVSGGGGGPRARLDTGPGRRHPDDLYPGPALRPFHFLLYAVDDAHGLRVEARGIPKGAGSFSEIDRFEMPWP